MTIPTTVARRARVGPKAPSMPGLRCRVRLADGRTFAGELPVERHRALQLGMLHADSGGLVELAPGARRHANPVLQTPPGHGGWRSCARTAGAHWARTHAAHCLPRRGSGR